MRFLYSLILVFVLMPMTHFSQDIQLLQQFNGRFDYTAIGNTQNTIENGSFFNCTFLTSSSATLSLNTNQNVVAAYLYWAGSGEGDFQLSLNDTPISAERTFDDALDNNRVFFAAFADVTTIVQNTGSGLYTISDFDMINTTSVYCSTGTNFGGWAMVIVYEDSDLPLNQLNVYDGLQSVPDQLTITLDNLNVLDNENAKIGFIAWEGDASLAVNEQLTINGNIISNPPLNPSNNAFNGTNSFTGDTNLYNMDIDVYDIQDNINIGDSSATISLTSGQDFVMINSVVTVLNSQLPDAAVALDSYIIDCQQNLELEYIVYNTNATDILPSNTPIAFYINDVLFAQSETLNAIPIGGQESNTISFTVPDGIESPFELRIKVDDDGNQNGIVTETNENNNDWVTSISILEIPPVVALDKTIQCDEGFDTATFNLSALFLEYIETAENLSFYRTLNDLDSGQNAIFDPESFANEANPQTIYVKVPSNPCYDSYAFEIAVENCPPIIPEGFSPNNDTRNDWFNIQGLYDIFERHNLLIYNRYGTLIFEGNNSLRWDGKANRGLNNLGKLLPVGTYFYVLNLNDDNYKPIVGWVYMNY